MCKFTRHERLSIRHRESSPGRPVPSGLPGVRAGGPLRHRWFPWPCCGSPAIDPREKTGRDIYYYTMINPNINSQFTSIGYILRHPTTQDTGPAYGYTRSRMQIPLSVVSTVWMSSPLLVRKSSVSYPSVCCVSAQYGAHSAS